MSALGYCRRRGCGSPLVAKMDALGRLVVGCEPCARNAADLCRDCPKPKKGPRSLRCAACTYEHNRADDLRRKNEKYRSDDAWRERECAKRRAARRDPVKGPRIVERDRAYRAGRPRESDRSLAGRLYKRVWAKAHPLTRDQRDRQNARRRERYANDPDYRARILASNNKRPPLTPAQRARANASWRNRYANDPEFRARQITDVTERRAQRTAALPLTGFVNCDADRILGSALQELHAAEARRAS
jgi:hypothetical protein